MTYSKVSGLSASASAAASMLTLLLASKCCTQTMCVCVCVHTVVGTHRCSGNASEKVQRAPVRQQQCHKACFLLTPTLTTCVASSLATVTVCVTLPWSSCGHSGRGAREKGAGKENGAEPVVCRPSFALCFPHIPFPDLEGKVSLEDKVKVRRDDIVLRDRAVVDKHGDVAGCSG